MAEVNDGLGSIYQNLIDAGCDTNTTEQCMAYMERGRYSDILPILSRYRETLLGTVHRGQKQIDCLDFLIYKLKKIITVPNSHKNLKIWRKRHERFYFSQS